MTRAQRKTLELPNDLVHVWPQLWPNPPNPWGGGSSKFLAWENRKLFLKIGNCSWKSEIVLENRKLFLKIGNCSWKSEIILENRKLFLKIGNCSWKSEIILENRKLFLKIGNYSWNSEIILENRKFFPTNQKFLWPDPRPPDFEPDWGRCRAVGVARARAPIIEKCLCSFISYYNYFRPIFWFFPKPRYFLQVYALTNVVADIANEFHD